MCRLPMNRRCTELRTADSRVRTSTSSWAFALAAGLEGIRDRARPGRAGQHRHLLGRGLEELAGRGVHRLPRSLGEAVDAFEADDLARETFGTSSTPSYVRSSGVSGTPTTPSISEWEREQYLHLW